jgi:hypothetical protein
LHEGEFKMAFTVAQFDSTLYSSDPSLGGSNLIPPRPVLSTSIIGNPNKVQASGIEAGLNQYPTTGNPPKALPTSYNPAPISGSSIGPAPAQTGVTYSSVASFGTSSGARNITIQNPIQKAIGGLFG